MENGETKTVEQRLIGIEQALHAQETLLKAVYAHTQKTQRFIFWGRIMSMLYLFLIIAPLIFAAYYLPPLIQQYSGVYKDLLDVSGSVKGSEALFDNLEKQLQMFQGNQGR